MSDQGGKVLEFPAVFVRSGTPEQVAAQIGDWVDHNGVSMTDVKRALDIVEANESMTAPKTTVGLRQAPRPPATTRRDHTGALLRILTNLQWLCFELHQHSAGQIGNLCLACDFAWETISRSMEPEHEPKKPAG